MRGLPWRLVLRADRKSVLTAIAIGVVASSALAGFSLAALLESETISSEGPFALQDAVFPAGKAPASAASATMVRLLDARIGTGEQVTLAHVTGALAPTIPEGEAWTADFGALDHLLTFEDGSNLTLARIDAWPYAAEHWLLVSDEDAARLGVDAGEAYVLISGLESANEAPRDAGRAPAVQPFFERSSREIGRDLVLVVIFSCVLVAIFSYEFIRSEIRERRREIAVWRSLGMDRRGVATLVIARAAAISAGASLTGVLLSYLLLSQIAAATTLESLSLPGPLTVVAVLAAITLAGTIGAIIPARLATRIEVREAMEERA